MLIRRKIAKSFNTIPYQVQTKMRNEATNFAERKLFALI
jgi:hypothetical protein